MPKDNEEVKDVETVHIEPEEGEDDEKDLDDEETETPPASSAGKKTTETPDEKDDDEEEGDDKDDEDESKKKDELRGRNTSTTTKDDEIADVEGETPREKALRKEVTRLRRLNRTEKTNELIGDVAPVNVQEPLPSEDEAILQKYNPEELKNLEEVVDVLAKKKGWMKKGEAVATSLQDTANTFFEGHPEYSKENDPEGVLWNQFVTEYKRFVKADNPKDLKRILDRVHKEVFGIQSTSELGKVHAKRNKLNTASGANASPGSSVSSSRTRTAAPPEARSILKGFSDEELDEILG